MALYAAIHRHEGFTRAGAHKAWARNTMQHEGHDAREQGENCPLCRMENGLFEYLGAYRKAVEKAVRYESSDAENEEHRLRCAIIDWVQGYGDWMAARKAKDLGGES